MGAPAKFLFDVDFAAPDRGLGAVSRGSQAAEARSYRAGFEAAQLEAAALTERRMADASAQIAANLQSLSAQFAATAARVEVEAVGVAVTVARKLANELLAAEPLAEIVALVEDCLRHLVATPHLVVRLNDALYDGCRARLEDLGKHSGFQGKLVILADPDIAGSDCRIEWADGGVVREQREIDARIAELVRNYLASRSVDGLHTRTDP